MTPLIPSPRAGRPTARRWMRASALAAFGAALLLGLPGGSRLGVGPFASPSPARAGDDDEPVDPQAQAAIDKALAWLAKNQKPEGNWAAGSGISTSVPSLAVMAFLARGHIPGQGPYGDVMNKAIDYVLAQQKEDGLISGNNGNAHMYEHGISTAMLSEAYGMVDDTRKARIEKALAKSAQLILDAQRPHKGPKNMPYTGGWRYQKNSEDADISVTGWQLMGLRGAANCGATVPADALAAGREFVRRCAVAKDAGGGFAYQAGDAPGHAHDASAARTGTGILSLEMLGEHGTPEALAGGDYLLEHPLTDPNQGFYFYGVYYISQSFNQLGGKYWQTGYPKLIKSLLAAQNDQGIWANGSGQEQEAGDAYRTSMAVLALCVPYRYLPLYQK